MRMNKMPTVRSAAVIMAGALGATGLAGCGEEWLSDDQAANAPGLYGHKMPESITSMDVDTSNVTGNHLSFIRDGIAKLDMFLKPGEPDPECGSIRFEKEPGSADLTPPIKGSFEDWPIANSPYERGGSCNFPDEAIEGNPEGALEQVDKLIPQGSTEVNADAAY